MKFRSRWRAAESELVEFDVLSLSAVVWVARLDLYKVFTALENTEKMIPSSSPSSNRTPTGTDYHENYEQTMSEFIAPHTWIIVINVCALGLSPMSECVCSHKLLLVAKNIELKLKWRVNHSTQNWDRITYFCSNDFLFFSPAVSFFKTNSSPRRY